jgi:hypothetical protein
LVGPEGHVELGNDAMWRLSFRSFDPDVFPALQGSKTPAFAAKKDVLRDIFEIGAIAPRAEETPGSRVRIEDELEMGVNKGIGHFQNQ